MEAPKSRFESAMIFKGNRRKVYATLPGFRRGLKANNCPFIVNHDGLFLDIEGGLLARRQWNAPGGRRVSAELSLRDYFIADVDIQE